MKVFEITRKSCGGSCPFILPVLKIRASVIGVVAPTRRGQVSIRVRTLCITRVVTRLLRCDSSPFVNFPEASTIADPRGTLPIHYVACQPFDRLGEADMLLVTNFSCSRW
jgi:hypothetical protein